MRSEEKRFANDFKVLADAKAHFLQKKKVKKNFSSFPYNLKKYTSVSLQNLRFSYPLLSH